MLDGEESLLLELLGVVDSFDEESSGVTLHLDDDLRQCHLANVFQLGQLTSAEHHLEGEGGEGEGGG